MGIEKFGEQYSRVVSDPDLLLDKIRKIFVQGCIASSPDSREWSAGEANRIWREECRDRTKKLLGLDT
jgi:hypothetical protein